jgi:hypothetical protein
MARQEERRPGQGGAPDAHVGGGIRATLHAAPLADELASRRALRSRFGAPSSYGLTSAELAAHIGQCRRAGWLRWEIGARFGRWAA